MRESKELDWCLMNLAIIINQQRLDFKEDYKEEEIWKLYGQILILNRIIEEVYKLRGLDYTSISKLK